MPPPSLSFPAHLRPTLTAAPCIEAPDPAGWSLYGSSPSYCTIPSAVAVAPENPHPPPSCSKPPSSSARPVVVEGMAFQRADPASFIPDDL